MSFDRNFDNYMKTQLITENERIFEPRPWVSSEGQMKIPMMRRLVYLEDHDDWDEMSVFFYENRLLINKIDFKPKFKKNEGIPEFTTRHEYDGNGKIYRENVFIHENPADPDENDLLKYINYEYKENAKILHYYNFHDQPTWHAGHYYDEEGKVVHEEYANGDGSLMHINEFKYDEQGRLAIWGKYGPERTLFEQHHLVYNEYFPRTNTLESIPGGSGMVYRIHVLDDSENLLHYWAYVYPQTSTMLDIPAEPGEDAGFAIVKESGQLCLGRARFSPDNEPLEYHQYNYDEYGRLKADQLFDGNKKLQETIAYVYE